jgi:hypothetical protein
MTGGGSIFDTTGSEVAYTGRTTHGFEIHCDTRFDDPTISPNPPDASFDTFVGVGVGKYNGTPGFCISLRLPMLASQAPLTPPTSRSPTVPARSCCPHRVRWCEAITRLTASEAVAGEGQRCDAAAPSALRPVRGSY